MHASSLTGDSVPVPDSLLERVLTAFMYSCDAYTPRIRATFHELVDGYGNKGLLLLGAVLFDTSTSTTLKDPRSSRGPSIV